MATLRQLKDRVAELGCTLTDHDDYADAYFTIEPPDGKMFENGSHVLLEYYSNAVGQSWKLRAYQHLMDDLYLVDDPED